MSTKKKIPVSKKTADQIVEELENNPKKGFVPVAHAEMMRRFIVEIEKFNRASHRNTVIIITLTLFIVLLTSVNLITKFFN